MDLDTFKNVFDFIHACVNQGFYIVQGFNVSYWYRGQGASFFAAIHHMASTIPMLSQFAPRVVHNNVSTTLDPTTLTVQAHIAVLLKYLLMHDAYDIHSLRIDSRTVLDMDHVFARLKALYPDQAADIEKTIEPGFAAVLTGTNPRARDLIKVIYNLLNDKVPR